MHITTHHTVTALVMSLLMFSSPAGRADCAVESGPRTAALIELYTSEGCSSCPAADRQLSALAHTLDADAEVVPLAMHVSYWDALGWPDRYAQLVFDQRQQWLVQTNHQQVVYTPQFFVAGRELRAWQQRLRDEVRAVNAQAAAAHIAIRAHPQADDTLSLDVKVAAVAPNAPAVLYLALAESGLRTAVKRGENGGRVLTHEHVVHTWLGPLAVAKADGAERRALPLAVNWQRDQLEVIAIVQDPRSGQVLQTLRAQHCATS